MTARPSSGTSEARSSRTIISRQPHGPGKLCADWHGERDVIATGGPDGVVRLWKPDGTRWSKLDLRHPSSIEVLAFSPDGRWLATGCRDGGLRLWAVNTGLWTGASWIFTRGQ